VLSNTVTKITLGNGVNGRNFIVVSPILRPAIGEAIGPFNTMSPIVPRILSELHYNQSIE